MKKILLVATSLFMSLNAQASLITWGSGNIELVSDVYFNTDVPQGINLASQGVGSVQTIKDSTGTVWSAGSAASELNFFFDNLSLDFTEVGIITNSFADVSGDLFFYENTLGTFQASGDFLTDASALVGGDLMLGASGHPISPNNWTVIGQSNAETIGGNGNLDVWAGSAYDVIMQDQVSLSDLSLADMSFNFSGDKLLTNGYDWSGSADFSSVSTVPLPASIWLFGAGMVGLLGVTRRKSLEV